MDVDRELGTTNSSDKSIKVSVVLPTYNEKGNIIGLLTQLVTTLEGMSVSNFELLVIDDNSNDGTPQAVEGFIKEDDRVKLTVRREERGLATAVRKGIELSRGDVIVLMDTDFNHDPKDVRRLIEPIGGFDIVVGSRYTKGGFMESSWIRHYLSYLFNLFIRSYLGLKTTDNLSGFMAMKRTILSGLDKDLVFSGFGEFHVRLIYWIFLKGYRVLEVPTVYYKRNYGRSKFNYVRNLIRYTWFVLRTKKYIRLP